jgi:hypothetical protein
VKTRMLDVLSYHLLKVEEPGLKRGDVRAEIGKSFSQRAKDVVFVVTVNDDGPVVPKRAKKTADKALTRICLLLVEKLLVTKTTTKRAAGGGGF